MYSTTGSILISIGIQHLLTQLQSGATVAVSWHWLGLGSWSSTKGTNTENMMATWFVDSQTTTVM